MSSLIIFKSFCWLLKMVSEHKIQDASSNMRMQKIKFHFLIKIFIEKLFDKSLYYVYIALFVLLIFSVAEYRFNS